jgi:predicted alpha/beta-hydrolase family hydrolase
MLIAMDMLFDGDANAERTFLFAHGAGGAMDTPFMSKVARAIAARGIRVGRFEFPYMAARREGKRKGAPDREPVLLASWREAIGQAGGPGSVAIGGKSLGGRMASMIADEQRVRALVCFGYPFHPPGQPERLRTRHLETLSTPSLILQGERDPFGTRDDVGGYSLSPAIRVEWMTDGDHSFKPRAASGVTLERNLERAIELAAAFIRAH